MNMPTLPNFNFSIPYLPLIILLGLYISTILSLFFINILIRIPPIGQLIVSIINYIEKIRKRR